MRKYTVKRDSRDFRDLFYRSTRYIRENQLPKRIDLRSRMSPVVDQGSLGSCTSNAIVSGLREYLLLHSRSPLVRLSRLFHYWHERELEGTIQEDSGATVRDGMKVLNQTGVCPEEDWPYRKSRLTETPDPRAEMDARLYRISGYHRIHDLPGLKAALAEEQPVVFGISVYESFERDQAAKTGKIPYPNKRNEKRLGGHALLAVGYRDGKKKGQGVVIARNSWGTGWGNKGYCYIPYRFFRDKDLIFDLWTGR
jgi:C1A family cysteine protease